MWQPQVVGLELPETTEQVALHSVELHRLTTCEATPLTHLPPSTPDLAIKHRFVEVDESYNLRKELNSRKAWIQLAEKRCNEKLRQSQEAQRQEITSLKMHISKQNTLVEAQYAEQLRQNKQAFEQESLQKEQAMQWEFQELLVGMQQKEEAMRRELERKLTKAQVSQKFRHAVCTLKMSHRLRESKK